VYPSTLSKEQWKLIEPFFAKTSRRGAPPKYTKEAIFNAILYLLREGCRWRALPHDLPPWQIVYKHFRQWQARGVWAQAVAVLNIAWRQRRLGRSRRLPRHAIIDSQSVKSAAEGEEHGFHGGKKIKGRSRHIAVDSQGSLLALKVCAANHHDSQKAPETMAQAVQRYPSLEDFTGDLAYESAANFAREQLDCDLHLARKSNTKGFTVTKFRWIVERTFAWFGQCRRLSKDYETTTTSSEAFLWIAMLRLLVRRLA